jgi:RNA polymerase sigma-70 factor (ECF subfamily)
MNDDTQLIKQIADGDSKAFESLLDKYNNQIYGFCMRMLANKNLAEDIAQETWLRVIQNAKNYSPKAQASTWIITIAKNLCLDEIRKTAKFEELDAETENLTQDPSENCLEYLSKASDTETVKQALDQLTDRHRTVLCLWIYDECSLAELAIQLKISVNAVKVLLHRAKQNFEIEYSKLK